ncbi:ABC-F family ATP-binding cassette domain-containing protein [bacterium SCSIO 12741]|nr:ABC-F family ATP-binding cassette domain-containing protein [bacterium SCSIO 12741]
MFALSKIGMFVSGRDLFKDLSFMIGAKDRIGLVGKNGAGKSTLLKILAGVQKPTSGTVDISSGRSVGYLPQEIKFDSNQTVFGETYSVFKEVAGMEAELHDINHQLETRTDYESEGYSKLIERLNEIHEKLGTLEADKLESRIEKVLKGLGFKREEFDRPLDQFSGGWQMRVELAKILLRNHDLLLLDEPTNHLDIESILWLEDYLKNYPGAIMMVSHDKRFLDNITNRTIEIVFGKIYDYKAAYTKYMVLRQERYDQQVATYKNQQKYIEQQERFVERFKAKASKAKQAQSIMKQLDRLERVEMDEFETASIQFSFPPAPRSGERVLELKDLGKTYGEKTVLQGIDLKVLRGQRLAFVGKNGMGKSTLVKIINRETDCNGICELGHNVKIGYYAQVQEKTLNQDMTVLETLEHEATGDWTKTHRLRGLLGAFLFGEDDIDKKVRVLSGGEKSRLALARLLLHEINLLILDEPTNHLDMAAKDVLKTALQNFDGTLIVVSHDRDFLQDLTDVTFEFRDQKIKEHLGSIDEFLDKYKLEHFREFEMNKPSTTKAAASPKKEEKESDNKLDYQARKQRDKDIRKLRNSITKCERRIEEIEAELEDMEAKMADPEIYAQKTPESKDLFFKHAELKSTLDRKMAEWETLHAELEEMEG